MNTVVMLMRFLKLGLFVLCFSATVGLTGNSNAQEISQEHIKAARAAMAATGATERLDGILPEIAAFTKAGLIANRPDIEAEISNIVNEVAIFTCCSSWSFGDGGCNDLCK